jgi:hypothetical protein
VRYSRADQIVPCDRWTSEVSDDLPVDTLLSTTLGDQHSVRREDRYQYGPRESDEYRALVRLKVGGIDCRAIAWGAPGFVHDLSSPLLVLQSDLLEDH